MRLTLEVRCQTFWK